VGIRLVSRARLGRGTSLVASTPPRGDAGLAMMALILAPIVFVIQNWLAYLIALAIVAAFIALLVGGLILFHWLNQRQAERVERERLDHYTRTEEEARRLAAERYFRQAEAHGQKQEEVDRVETPATARTRDMLRLEPPAMIAARHTLPATVALLLLLLAPADAVAAPNTPFASLCGRVLTGITFSARQAISLNRVCTITVGAGGVLRIADSNIGGRDLRLNLRGGGAVGVDPVSWRPNELGRGSSRCRRHDRPTRRSSGARWSSWCAPAAARRSWRASSSPRPRRSAPGSSRPGATVAGAMTA
jgi:hypothetical protein